MPGSLCREDDDCDQQVPQAHGTVTVIDSIETISADATIETIWQKAIEMTGFGEEMYEFRLGFKPSYDWVLNHI